jgi:hypothetical protein
MIQDMTIYDKEKENDKITATMNGLAEPGRQKGFQVETKKEIAIITEEERKTGKTRKI